MGRSPTNIQIILCFFKSETMEKLPRRVTQIEKRRTIGLHKIAMVITDADALYHDFFSYENVQLKSTFRLPASHTSNFHPPPFAC